MSIYKNGISVLVLAAAASGCATVYESVPPPLASTNPALLASAGMPKDKFLPEQTAVAAGTKYVFVQPGGGSLLLGPIFGSMNITANTKAMAERYKDSLISIDPTPVALAALAKVGVPAGEGPSAFSVKTFVFVQHCFDERFRLTLVFHVDGQSTPWVGRYSYHLPTSYQDSRFGSLSSEELSTYRTELADGAEVLAGLLKRDFAGDLPASGPRVRFGSLWLLGNPLAATTPDKLAFPNALLIEGTDRNVTIRLRGSMSVVEILGGMTFGVHRFDRNQVHILIPNPPRAVCPPDGPPCVSK